MSNWGSGDSYTFCLWVTNNFNWSKYRASPYKLWEFFWSASTDVFISLKLRWMTLHTENRNYVTDIITEFIVFADSCVTWVLAPISLMWCILTLLQYIMWALLVCSKMGTLCNSVNQEQLLLQWHHVVQLCSCYAVLWVRQESEEKTELLELTDSTFY